MAHDQDALPYSLLQYSRPIPNEECHVSITHDAAVVKPTRVLAAPGRFETTQHTQEPHAIAKHFLSGLPSCSKLVQHDEVGRMVPLRLTWTLC